MSLDPAPGAWLGSGVISSFQAVPPAVLALAVLLAPARGQAQTAPTGPSAASAQPPQSPARSRALALLASVEAEGAHQSATQAVTKRARHALDRASGASKASDHRHAAELEALALELAEMARDLVRTLAAERQALDLSKRATAAETRAVRAQALVEQTAARRGRAAAQLAALEAERRAKAAGVPSKPAPAPAPGPAQKAPGARK